MPYQSGFLCYLMTTFITNVFRIIIQVAILDFHHSVRSARCLFSQGLWWTVDRMIFLTIIMTKVISTILDTRRGCEIFPFSVCPGVNHDSRGPLPVLQADLVPGPWPVPTKPSTLSPILIPSRSVSLVIMLHAVHEHTYVILEHLKLLCTTECLHWYIHYAYLRVKNKMSGWNATLWTNLFIGHLKKL